MIIVGDILIGSGSKTFFNQQIKFLLELSKRDSNILFLGNIFQNKKSVNMFQYNMFVRVIKKFQQVIIILNKNDQWLDNSEDINAVSFLESLNVRIISKPTVLNGIALIPKQFDRDGLAAIYRELEFNDYSKIITNDVTSKFAVKHSEAPIISNETNYEPNVTKVTTFNNKRGDDELFAYTFSGEKILNDTQPKFIRMMIEEFKTFGYEKVRGNHMIVTSTKTYKNIFQRNKLINILKKKLVKLGAISVEIDIKDADKVKVVKIKDITSYINKMNTIDNKLKKKIVTELSEKFKD